MAEPDSIYKVLATSLAAAARAEGVLHGAPVDLDDGFIHFSTAAQLRETLRLHFAGQGDLELLCVRTSAVAGDLRWEPSRGGQLFPHLYAPLPMSAVGRSAPIAVAADGSVELPDWVR